MAAARRAAGLARGALGRGRGGAAGTDPAGLAGGRRLGARPGGADAAPARPRGAVRGGQRRCGMGGLAAARGRPRCGRPVQRDRPGTGAGRAAAAVPAVLRGGFSRPDRRVPPGLVLRGDPGLAVGLDHPHGVQQPSAGKACLPAHLLQRPVHRGARPVVRGSNVAGRDPDHAADPRIRGRHPLPDLAALPGHPEHAGHRHRHRLAFRRGMYAVDPLGLSKAATNPWLPGSTAGPLVALAWILLFGGPAAAAVLAGRRCRGPDGSRPPGHARIGQGVAAGVLANGTQRWPSLLSARARRC